MPMAVSVTVAVHSVDELTASVDGLHDTAMLVARAITVTARVPALPAWAVSPPPGAYVAVIVWVAATAVAV